MGADRHVVVVGLMGAGKTTVGRALAAHLAVPFVDNDEQLHDLTGRTAGELQRERGRDALHAAELAALERALDRDEPSVTAAAASVVDIELGRRLLASAHTVWLDVDAGTRHARVAGPDHRPPQVSLSEERERAERFAELAERVVGDGPVDVVVDALGTWALDALA